jgi:hypothetical protein
LKEIIKKVVDVAYQQTPLGRKRNLFTLNKVHKFWQLKDSKWIEKGEFSLKKLTSYQIIDNLLVSIWKIVLVVVQPHSFWPLMTFRFVKLKSLCLFFYFFFLYCHALSEKKSHALDIESEPLTGLATSLYSRPFHNSKVNFLATMEKKEKIEKWKMQADEKINLSKSENLISRSNYLQEPWLFKCLCKLDVFLLKFLVGKP